MQLAHANNVIHISISSKIEHSGYQPALDASKSFDNVFVIDSGHLSSGQGLMAVVAARMAEEGLTAEQIVSELEVYKKKIHTSFIVEIPQRIESEGSVGKYDFSKAGSSGRKKEYLEREKKPGRPTSIPFWYMQQTSIQECSS